MSELKIVFKILKDEEVHSIDSLQNITGYSERKIRTIISELRSDGTKSGFEIETIKKQG